MLYSTVASDGGYYIALSIGACYIVCYRTTKETGDCQTLHITRCRTCTMPHTQILDADYAHRIYGSSLAARRVALLNNKQPISIY